MVPIRRGCVKRDRGSDRCKWLTIKTLVAQSPLPGGFAAKIGRIRLHNPSPGRFLANLISRYQMGELRRIIRRLDTISTIFTTPYAGQTPEIMKMVPDR